MALTKDEFLKIWLDAKESQEPHIIETAWKRYQHTQEPTYQTSPESADPNAEDFKASFQGFLSDPNISSSIEKTKFITRHANKLPWTATGIDLKPGQRVSTFASGRVWRSRILDVFLRAQFALYFRVGVNGEVFNATRDTNTFEAEHGGELYLANQFPGAWQEKTGRVLGDLNIYENAGDGKFEILVVVWKGGIDVEDLLLRYPEQTSASQSKDGLELLKMERERPSDERETNLPKDWYYFWWLGKSTIYRSLDVNNGKCINCKPQKNIGILLKDLGPTLNFQRGCKVSWDWKLDAIPSRVREDTTFSHDYLSIAFEFENGKDITYTWSWELPKDYGYWCPLPTWEAREYHVAIRSGPEGLGQWLSEQRDLYGDYEHYISKEDVPERITRVWLISSAAFQRREGEMTVKAASIENGGQVTEIL